MEKREVPGANVNSGNDPVSVHTSELEMDDEISFRKNDNFLICDADLDAASALKLAAGKDVN